MSVEPILDPANSQLTIYPIRYRSIWDSYQKQLSSFWKAQEIDFSKDYDDFQELNDNEKHFVKMVLAFFAASDGIVNWNLSERFMKDIQIMEAKVAYSFQMMMENVHGETYSLMLDNIVRDREEKQRLFEAIHTIDSVRKMKDWAVTWIQSEKSFAHRLIAFCVVEGVFFSGAFAAIYWLKKYRGSGRSFMMGLVKSNDFISRDEGMHTEFGCLLYGLLQNKLAFSEVLSIVTDGVSISQEFITESLGTRLMGIDADRMTEYIQYIADRLLVSLGYSKHYNQQNPFSFMETIGLTTKTNFFEQRPTEYGSATVLNASKNFEVKLDDDF
jgi:ribonucleotide reductase beta subunit family protein with ferritin-like domain